MCARMSAAELDQMLHAVAQQYPLTGLRAATVLPTTGRNINVVMADSGGTLFVLRCYRRNTDVARIEFQLDFQEHLRRGGIPSARIVATKSGARLVQDGKHLWVLFGHIAGTGYDYTSHAQLRNAAQCLAALHATAEDFPGAPIVDDTIPDVRRWWTHGADDLAELHDMFADRHVEAELAFLVDWWTRLTRDFPLEIVDQLPQRWVHADYHGGNLAFVDNRVVGVFDFDVVHRGFRVEDVAHAAFCFARENASSNVVRIEMATQFLDQFDLTDLERLILPTFMVATQARNAARYRIREREGADPAHVLRHHVARMRELTH